MPQNEKAAPETESSPSSAQERRRRFLQAASKYAIGLPPAITLLIASRGALAKNSNGNNGFGNGGGDGSNAGFEDVNR